MKDKNSNVSRATAFLMALGLVLMSLVVFAPTTAAHLCHAEKGSAQEEDCGAVCTEGEYHNHRIGHHHENGIGEDEDHTHYRCESKATSGGGGDECDGPEVLGLCVIEPGFDPSTVVDVPAKGLLGGYVDDIAILNPPTTFDVS